MDEKNRRGSMKEDQDRERQSRRQETPGRSPLSPGSRSSGRGSNSTPGSNRPGGGSSSGLPGNESQKGSRGYFHDEEQESER
jgi:hypothetical protein